MKLNKVILGAFALSMGFASCSNEEPVKGPNEGGVNGVSYMAVAISNLGQGGSRAAALGDPDEYLDAEGNEGLVTAANLYFLFFDDQGRAFPLAYANVNGAEVKTNMVKPENISQDQTTGGDAALTGTLVLGKAVDEPYVGTTPTQVICVANPNTTVMASLENIPLSEVLAKTTQPNSDLWYGDDAKFLMTNATYVNEAGKLIQAVDVSGNIKETMSEAQNNPAKIYIERVVAKVRTSYSPSYTVQRRVDANTVETTGKFMLDNAEVSFTAEINGWQLYNTASQAKAFKNLATDYPSFSWKWNDPTNHRSYWAESASGATKLKNTYNIYGDDEFKNGSFTSGLTNIEYCYENTEYSDAEVTSRARNEATGIVIKATIKKDGEAINMMRWAGTYYTVGRLKERIAAAYKAAFPDVEVSVDKVGFAENTNTNTYYATYDGTSMAYLFDDILWWKDGVTSYYTNIEHLANANETNCAVVRNHIYDYTIQGIIGLGIPGNNPDMPEEEPSFLACRVRILDWHVISNNVTLE